jgi:sugar lactone lactonase YvrE
MWFATKDGLNRYDGYNFVVYKHDPSNNQSVSDSYINWMFEDSKGRIWIGTASHGLDLFDRKSETFQHFTVLKSSNSITNNQIQSIGEDENGILWIICNNHHVSSLSIKEEKGKAVYSFKKNAANYITIKKRKIRYSANPNNYNLNKLATPTDTLYIKNRRLYNKSSSNIVTQLLPENQNFDKYFSNINTIYQDKSGVIWIGTKGYGILKYNPNVNKFHLTNTGSVYFISPLRDGTVLVNEGGKDNLRHYDKTKLTFRDWGNLNIPGFNSIISNDNGGEITPSVLRGKIDQYKPDFVIVDYLQLMSPNQKSDNETVRMKNLSRELKLMAIGEEVPIIAISSATPDDVNDLSSVPTLGQTAWSRQISYDADWLLALGRGTNSDVIECVFRKNRNGFMGDFLVQVDFDKGYYRYKDFEDGK